MDSKETLHWYSLPIQTVFEKVGSSVHGLSDEVAKDRLSQFGPNVLPSAPEKPVWVIFLSQFTSPLIAILILSAVAVAFIGEVSDSIVISLVLLFNAIIGTYQEGKAQHTLESLKHFTHTKATVLREHKESVIDHALLVPGDIVVLREGEKVPADCRLFEATGLMVDEAALTGESLPVAKNCEVITSATRIPIADQTNMVLKGSYVTNGYGKAIVIHTGKQTVIGELAKEMSHLDTQVPLKRKIESLSKKIVLSVVAFCVLFVGIALLRSYTPKDALFTIISLCVSLIPEGLPVILTLVLAMSVYRMSKRSALVKKLHAVEALGHATVIAVDKTGTITLNELTVTNVWTKETVYEVSGSGYEPIGDITVNNQPIDATEHKILHSMLSLIRSCSKAQVTTDDEKKRHAIGDPTEAALTVLAAKAGITTEQFKCLHSDPFDYKRKYSAHIVEKDRSFYLTALGAPEALLQLCTNKKNHKAIEAQVLSFSKQGLRVVALASKRYFQQPKMDELEQMEIVALFAMQDSIHPQARESILAAKDAGMKVVMITGDHKDTATTIAASVGIYEEGNGVLTGSEIDTLSPAELAKILPTITVFARVTPQHKLALINAYRKLGETIAMTGDGVNDAASLVAADLGIAMGNGTEVAKEAADIVLLDDNFQSITAAIKEGRHLYLTVKNVILYLFSTSVGEALTLFVALLLGIAAPLLPIQIIWLNLVTDGFLDVGLSMEPRQKGLLKMKWTHQKSELVDHASFVRMILIGTTMMIGTLFVFWQYKDGDITKALTISLTTLAAFQWFNAWNCRSATRSVTQLSLFGNPHLLAATFVVVILHILAVHLPLFQQYLHTTALSFAEWLMCLGIASTIIAVEEIRKSLFSTK